MKVEIDYNGGYPNLCSGNLIVTIDNKVWNFSNYCLISGGSVTFDEDWNENVTKGRWDIDDWPENFPENLKKQVLYQINLEIPWGCCGGCV